MNKVVVIISIFIVCNYYFFYSDNNDLQDGEKYFEEVRVNEDSYIYEKLSIIDSFEAKNMKSISLKTRENSNKKIIIPSVKKKEKKKKKKKKKFFNKINVIKKIEDYEMTDFIDSNIGNIDVIESTLQFYKDIIQKSSYLEISDKESDPLLSSAPLRTAAKANESDTVIVLKKSSNEIYLGENSIEFFVEAYINNKGIVPEKVEATIYDPFGEKHGTLTFKQNGMFYRAVYEPSSAADIQFGKYLLKYEITINNIINYRIDTFSLEMRMARFGRRIKSKIDRDGNLEVKPQFKISHDGNYLVMATLYDQKGRSIAYEESVLNLRRGKRWAPIIFPGKIFNKKKINGPYILKHLAISSVSADLSVVRQDLVTLDYMTDNYSWSDFNSTSMADKDVKSKLEKLETFIASLGAVGEQNNED